MVNIYREADRRRMERTNVESHLMGMYIYEALCDVSPILHAFAKKWCKTDRVSNGAISFVWER